MEKLEALSKTSSNIEKLKEHFPLAIKSVPGEGNPDSNIVFLGEAPGQKENETGRPFVGRAGMLLTQLLNEIGIDRKDVFITSIVKFYPGMRAPNREEIEMCLPLTMEQIDIIGPKIIVLMGNIALKAMVDKKMSVMKCRGKVIEKDGRKFFVTLHPAAAIRFKKYVDEIRKDFSMLKDVLSD